MRRGWTSLSLLGSGLRGGGVVEGSFMTGGDDLSPVQSVFFPFGSFRVYAMLSCVSLSISTFMFRCFDLLLGLCIDQSFHSGFVYGLHLYRYALPISPLTSLFRRLFMAFVYYSVYSRYVTR